MRTPLLLLLLTTACHTAQLNVSHQRAGAFFAGGRTEGLGGFAPSDNLPVDAPPQAAGLSTLEILVWPVDNDPSTNQVWLVNGSAKELAFEAQDSRLPMIHEAQDRAGIWRAIEHLPESWCGNSDHEVFLPAGKAWKFSVPIYTGSFATRLRLRLDTPAGPLYSRAFAGRINPAQLDPQNRQTHRAQGIMDPY
jgi:hypothetical protein